MAQFNVTVYDTASGEPRQRRIDIAGSRLHFPGERTEGVLLSNLVLELVATKNPDVRISDPHSGLVLTTDNPAVLGAIAASQAPETVRSTARLIYSRMPNMPRRRVLEKVTLGALLLTGILLGAQLLSWITDQAVARITPQMEEEISTAYVKKYDESSPEAQRVQRVGERLVAAMPNPIYHFHFYVDPSDQINAFCLTGGNIVVLNGMLSRIKSDDELAGILGHELGHSVHRDTVRKMAHDLGVEIATAMVFGHIAQLKTLVAGAKGLERLKFSRNEEAAADKSGVEFAHAAHYNAAAMADLFQRLKDETGDMGALTFLSDHPATSERIEAIRNEAARLR